MLDASSGGQEAGPAEGPELKLKRVRPAEPSEWDRAWTESDTTTFYHSREWYETFCAYKSEFSTEAWVYEFNDGLQAIFPVVSNKAASAKISYSSPAGTFGGWISTQRLGIEHGRLIMADLRRRFPDMTWVVNPYDQVAQELGANGKSLETHALRLSGSFEEVYKRGSKGHTSAERKARREGVRSRRAASASDWQTYFSLYEDSLRRWGDKTTSKYEWELFALLAQKQSRNVTLWLAEYQDRIIAGALCFYSKRHIGYWHGAALDSFFHLRPVHLLIYDIIRDACETGYSWFDFNPSGGHEGIRQFKEHFGCEVLPCPVLSWESLTTRVKRKLRAMVGGGSNLPP